MDVISANLVAAVRAVKDEICKILTTTATTAQLNSAAAEVNTKGKFLGKQVFNENSGRLVTALGPLPGDIWVNASTGSATHIPI